MGQPRLPESGEMEVTVGAGDVIANPLVSVYTLPSELVTTTFHGPATLPVRSNVQVIFSGDTTVTPLPAIVDVELVSFTDAVGWNPVPVRVTLTGQPRLPKAGMMPVMESRSYTMNGVYGDDIFPSVFLIVTS